MLTIQLTIAEAEALLAVVTVARTKMASKLVYDIEQRLVSFLDAPALARERVAATLKRPEPPAATFRCSPSQKSTFCGNQQPLFS